MHNPFYGIIKADELPARRATALFVPEASPIWSRVQEPTNQIIVGPRGSGKTIALRQLDHQTQELRGQERPYIGVYIQISRISTTFQSLFKESDEHGDKKSEALFQKVFSDNVWMEIVREIARHLQVRESERTTLGRSDLQRLTGIEADDLTQLEDRCIDVQSEIERRIQTWSVTSAYSWVPKADLATSLRRCSVELRKLIPTLNQQQPCIYLLFDESSPIPLACQHVLNGLLIRGREYCVKLAVRPYEWESLETTSARTIELDTDVKPLHIYYPNETQDSYVEDMASVVNLVLQDSIYECGFNDMNTPDIQRILKTNVRQQYAGFSSICAASSGNPQNLLQICSNIFAMEPMVDTEGRITFSAQSQSLAVRTWSKEYEDRNPDGVSRGFCRALLKSVRSRPPTDRVIGFRLARTGGPDLFGDEYMPAEFGDKILSGFSAGFLRPASQTSTSLFEVPAEFHLSRGLLPRGELRLDTPIAPPIEVGEDFIRKNAREARPIQGTPTRERSGELSAFLSTSFSPPLRQQRLDIKQHLQNVGVTCKDVEDVPADQFLFTTIRRLLKGSDITVLDATELRPFTMFEVGLCAGQDKPKAVICVVSEDSGGDPIARLPEAVRKLPILTYSSSPGDLERLAAQILSRGRELLEKPSEFAKVVWTGMSLRPRRRTNCVYVSVPDLSFRDAAYEKLSERLETVGWSVVTDQKMKTFGANELQVSIQCAYLSRIGVIDTTGETTPDLLQCFRLGLFAGKRRPWRVMRTERAGRAHTETFASVPLAGDIQWSTYDELADAVVKFVQS